MSKRKLRNVTREDGKDLARIDPRTVETRFSHPDTRDWVGHTQVWRWDDDLEKGDDGDAIVVVTGGRVMGQRRVLAEASAAVVIRVGPTVYVETGCHRGLYEAMQRVGLNPEQFRPC